jgi:hypothetical protein
MGSGELVTTGAPKETKTPPRGRVPALSNYDLESPAAPPASFGDWALGQPRAAPAVGAYGPGGSTAAIRTDANLSAAATGRSPAFPSLPKAKESRSNLDYAVASPTAERLYQVAGIRGPSDPRHPYVSHRIMLVTSVM